MTGASAARSGRDGWQPRESDRIIEIDPPDTQTFDHLRAAGCTRYLGLYGPGFAAPHGPDPQRFFPLGSAREIRANNADVLILNGVSVRHLWYRRIGWARYVAVPADSPSTLEARLASRVHRRPEPVHTVFGGRPYLAFDLGPLHWRGTRRYASQVVGLAELPRLLEERGIRYAVLRWFDRLPHVDPGEDLDVLVADSDLARFWELLDEEPGTIPVDLYSESGLPGSDYRAMAYYPPRLAAEILDHAVRLPSGYRAPSPAVHFRSLAYHAVYHKGPSSGLASTVIPTSTRPEHDYTTVLKALAHADGYDGQISLEALDDHLASVRWQPPRDTLAKLMNGNEWIRARFRPEDDAELPPPWLATFVVREKASGPDDIAALCALLQRRGFEVLEVAPLDDAARARCSTGIRGGNWGPGPFPTSGGDPAAVVVACDSRPRPPGPSERWQHPGLTNVNTLTAKVAFRDLLAERIPADARFNPLHSSDNEADAWHYLELAAPHLVDSVRHAIEQRRTQGAAVSGPAPRRRARERAMAGRNVVERRLREVYRKIVGVARTAARVCIDRRVIGSSSAGR